MINMLFLKIVAMSLTAGTVILVVLLVRLFIRRLPKSFSYILWIVVAFRMVVPVTADSGISIFNMFTIGSTDSESIGILGDKGIGMKTEDGLGTAAGNKADSMSGQAMLGLAENDTVNDTVNAHDNTESVKDGSLVEPGKATINTFIVNEIPDNVRNSSVISKIALIWIAGIMILVSYTVNAHIRIRRKIRYSVRLCDKVYECDNTVKKK